jgi:cysteine-rich repeat protein
MKVALLCVFCSSVIVVMCSPAFAAKSPAKVSAKCRQTIAKAVSSLAKVGLKEIDQCHKLRDKGNGTADCNVITVGSTTSWGRTETQQGGAIGTKCKPGEEVLGNYATEADPVGDPVGVVFPAARALLEENSENALGNPTFTGDKKVVKSLAKCHAAIGKTRTAIVLDILKTAQKCQKNVDKKASGFKDVGIDPSCIGGPGKKANKAIAKMQQQCKNVDPASVGTCDGFPDCVIADATKMGQTLAAFAYGGPTTCRNNVLELGEECDDGGESAECDIDCTPAECGDALVNGSSGEECDLGTSGATGNRDDGPCTTQCLNAVCGDGIQVAGLEECDDGNAVVGDGCTDCVIDGTICGSGGIVARFVLDTGPSGQGFAQFGSATLQTTYPGPLSLPGSGFLQIAARFTDLTGIGGLFFFATNDDATSGLSMTVAAAIAGGLPRDELPITEVQFDCVAGSEIRPGNFSCQVTELLDPQGNPLHDIVDDAFKRCFVSGLRLP